MKYLRPYNESLKTNSWLDKDFSSVEEIAKLIDSYFKEHVDSDLMYDMNGILEECHPEEIDRI
jgi:hypothetical protein